MADVIRMPRLSNVVEHTYARASLVFCSHTELQVELGVPQMDVSEPNSIAGSNFPTA